MQLTSDATVPALHFEHEDQFGEAFDVIVVRQAYAMTQRGLVPLDDQPEMLDTDAYFGEPPHCSVRAESDLAPYKPRCDVIVNATAHAPGGNASRSISTLLRVERQGPAGYTRVIDKGLLVTGERSWRRRSLPARIGLALLAIATFGLVRRPAWNLTRPRLFTECAVRYETAYGGECRVDATPQQRERLRRAIGVEACLTDEQLREHPDAGSAGPSQPLAHMAVEENPLGAGFCRGWYVRALGIDHLPAPRIAYADAPITGMQLWRAMKGGAAPTVAGYGCVGRAWLPRRALIGEVDMDCAAGDGACPRLPDDFDYGYWNAAPRDQQCDYLRGGDRISLVNLCRPDHPMARPAPAGDIVLSFALPDTVPYLALVDERRRIGARQLKVDTVVVEPDQGLVTLTWRVVLPKRAHIRYADVHFAATAEEKAALEAMLELQRQAAPDEEPEELAHAA